MFSLCVTPLHVQAHFLAETLSQCVATEEGSRPRFDRLVETLSSSTMGLKAALQPPGPISALQSIGPIGRAAGPSPQPGTVTPEELAAESPLATSAANKPLARIDSILKAVNLDQSAGHLSQPIAEANQKEEVVDLADVFQVTARFAESPDQRRSRGFRREATVPAAAALCCTANRDVSDVASSAVDSAKNLTPDDEAGTEK